MGHAGSGNAGGRRAGIILAAVEAAPRVPAEWVELKKQVEDLREQLRRLEKRLAEIEKKK